MPHALTERQKEVLQYVRGYVAQNESSPRLDEIANEFSVKAPTAHKYLKALQSKGFLYFGRDRVSGFFIRLIERAGTAETVVELAVAGRFDHFGELFDFPKEYGHFATILQGADPENVFALAAAEDLPQANIMAHDFIIFDMEKEPQPGDICIAPIGSRLFLIQINSRTFDERTPWLVMEQKYPLPEEQLPSDRKHHLHWHPLAYDEDTHDFFINVADEERFPIKPIPPDFIAGTALRLIRALTF